jgi:hypothetical protein
MIIFTPSKEFLETNASLKKPLNVPLEGHSGALYPIKKKNDGERYASPQTGSGDEDQNAWHTGLRLLFITATTPEALLTQIADYASAHVWDGALAGMNANQPIHFTDAKRSRLKDENGRPLMTLGQLSARQERYHDEILRTLARTAAELQKCNTK